MTLIYNTVITTATFALFALLHSVLANQDLKQYIFERWPAVQTYYRLGYTLISLIGLAAWFVYAPFPEGTLYEVPNPWNRVFNVLQGAGLAGFLFSLKPIDLGRFLGMKQLRTKPGSKRGDDPLVTRGLYHWVRHPLYSSSMIILLFNPYMSYKWALISLLFGLYFWIGSIYEERNLVDQYGAAYRHYRQQVPRFIPKFPLF